MANAQSIWLWRENYFSTRALDSIGSSSHSSSNRHSWVAAAACSDDLLINLGSKTFAMFQSNTRKCDIYCKSGAARNICMWAQAPNEDITDHAAAYGFIWIPGLWEGRGQSARIQDPVVCSYIVWLILSSLHICDVTVSIPIICSLTSEACTVMDHCVTGRGLCNKKFMSGHLECPSLHGRNLFNDTYCTCF